MTRRDIHLDVALIAEEMEILTHMYAEVHGLDHDQVQRQFQAARMEARHQQNIMEAEEAAAAIAARREART